MMICEGTVRYHKEVCYEGNICPACSAQEDGDGKEEELNDKISDLEARITKLEELHDSQIG